MPYFYSSLDDEIWVLVLGYCLEVEAVLEHHLARLSECSFEGIVIDIQHQPFSVLHGSVRGTGDLEGAQSRHVNRRFGSGNI